LPIKCHCCVSTIGLQLLQLSSILTYPTQHWTFLHVSIMLYHNHNYSDAIHLAAIGATKLSTLSSVICRINYSPQASLKVQVMSCLRLYFSAFIYFSFQSCRYTFPSNLHVDLLSFECATFLRIRCAGLVTACILTMCPNHRSIYTYFIGSVL